MDFLQLLRRGPGYPATDVLVAQKMWLRSLGVAHVVRFARPEDVPAIHALVKQLAGYEREPDAVTATADDFSAALFGPQPQVYCHVAEVDGRVVGFALWFVTFSTWLGRHGIWLEDLFVVPEYRGRGLGKALLAELARICLERGYGRLEWWVLHWNEPAIRFYRSLGAQAMDQWIVQRLDGAELAALSSQPSGR